MKINDSALGSTAASRLGGTAPAEGSGARKSGSAGSGADRVQISSLAGRLLSQLASDSPERLARIQQLTTEVRSGRYNPDSLATSRGIIAEALAQES